MKKHLYMIVTADKYELPLAVADTALELASMEVANGISKDCVYSRVMKDKKRKDTYSGTTFLKVELEGDSDAES